MKTALTLALSLMILAGSASAQRTVPGRSSLEAHRPLGEIRIWTFVQDDSTIGTLRSQIVDKTSIEGTPGYVIEEQLNLDFTRVGLNNTIHMAGEPVSYTHLTLPTN